MATEIPTRSQCAMILSDLRLGREVTQIEATTRYGCTRLAARIWDLRMRGHDIKSEKRRAGRKSFAAYYITQPSMF